MLHVSAMTGPLVLFLSVALFPGSPPEPGIDTELWGARDLVPGNEQVEPGGPPPDGAPVWAELSDAFRPENQDQVRIERRVIIRISPRLPLQDDPASDPPARPAPRRFEERRMGKCVPIKGIAGVQISRQDRLLLFMHDHRIISARLEKSCNVRDFYSGFYVENSQDGMICAGRDTLHSRAGVNCELSRFHRLVPEDE